MQEKNLFLTIFSCQLVIQYNASPSSEKPAWVTELLNCYRHVHVCFNLTGRLDQAIKLILSISECFPLKTVRDPLDLSHLHVL